MHILMYIGTLIFLIVSLVILVVCLFVEAIPCRIVWRLAATLLLLAY